MTVVYRDKTGVTQMTPVAYENEAELQLVLRNHPELLEDVAGATLHCIASEVELAEAGIADLLHIDSDGHLTVVEVKLARNAQSRREVMAQVFDYASALADYPIDKLDDLVGGALDERLRELAGGDDRSRVQYDKLWKSCADSMRAGSVRVVVALDEPREDLARIVRFVRDHSDLDVRLLVVRKYQSGARTVLVPEFVVKEGSVGVTRRSGPRRSTQAFADTVASIRASLPEGVTVGEGGPQWQIISVPGIPENGHYELQGNRGRPTPMFHLEGADIAHLAGPLQGMVAKLQKQFARTEVAWDPKWYGYGRLILRPPEEATPAEIADLMLKFIEFTRAELVAASAGGKRQSRT